MISGAVGTQRSISASSSSGDKPRRRSRSRSKSRPRRSESRNGKGGAVRKSGSYETSDEEISHEVVSVDTSDCNGYNDDEYDDDDVDYETYDHHHHDANHGGGGYDDDLNSDGEFGTEAAWDPETSREAHQAAKWKKTRRVQDIPTPAVVEDAGVRETGENGEEWPFRSPCAFQSKSSKKSEPRSAGSSASDIDSLGDDNEGGPDKANNSNEAWRLRESWKQQSTHSSSTRSSSESHHKHQTSAPKQPQRQHSSDEDDEEEDESFHDDTIDILHDEEYTIEVDHSKSSNGRRRTHSKSRRPSSESSTSSEDASGSFHGLVEDADKVRGGRRSRTLRGRRKGSGDSDDASSTDRSRSGSRSRRSAGGVRRGTSQRFQQAISGDDNLGSGSGHSSSRRGRMRRTSSSDSHSSFGSSASYHTGGGGGSANGDGDAYDSYEYDVSGRSHRTLDSIEDLEDFEHIDFQTPGMVDFDEEMLELMNRANPEDTAQLARRVHRQRDRLEYDQNMPMMTRQALLTRQHTNQQAMRQRVHTNEHDRKRLLLRNDSMSSMSGRMTPGSRRAPSRARSSGMMMGATLAPQQEGQAASGDDKRQMFRTRSSNTNSFRQYMNKPNRVAQISSRRPPESMDPHSLRGGSNSSGSGRRVQRAKSTTALRRVSRSDHRSTSGAGGESLTPGESTTEPAAIPPSASSSVSSSASGDEPRRRRRIKATASSSALTPATASTISTKGTSSDESDDGSTKLASPTMKAAPAPPRRKPPKRAQSHKITSTSSSLTPRSPPLMIKKRQVVNKRDMTVKRNRRKLHALMYEQKMGIQMKDLFLAVKKDPMTATAQLVLADE